MILDVRAERARIGMTRTRLALELGVGYDAVRKMEAPGWSPTVGTLERVAKVLGMRIVAVAIASTLCDNQGNHGEWCRYSVGHAGGCSWNNADGLR